MPRKKKIDIETIKENLELLYRSTWAEKLESINYLKGLETREEILKMSELTVVKESDDFVKDLNQIYEYILRDYGRHYLWDSALSGLFAILGNTKGKSKLYTEEAINKIIEDKLNLREDTRFHARPELVFALSRCWKRSDNETKFSLIKKVIKFRIRELYNLVPDSMETKESKLSIKIARSMVLLNETTIIPLLEKWAIGEDQEKKKEAVISLGMIGGLFEVPLLIKVLKKEKGVIRCEAVTSLMKILPYAGKRILKRYWRKEKDVNLKRTLLRNLISMKKVYVLDFIKEETVKNDFPELENDLIMAISLFSHPEKVRIVTSGFDQLKEDQKLRLLVALKGRPYPELEYFYLRELEANQANHILSIIILESLGHFQSLTIANALYRYIRSHKDMTTGYAFFSLVKSRPELAADFINTDFLFREEKSSILTQTFLKSLPVLSPYLKMTGELRALLMTRYEGGSLNEKTFIVRSLPFLLDNELFELAVESFQKTEDKSFKRLLGTSIIKCSFINPNFLEAMIPLMDTPELVSTFKKEKIKAPFVENLGVAIIEYDCIDTLFVRTLMIPILEGFLKNIDKFEVPAVVITYFKLLENYPYLVKEEHVDRAKAAYYKKGNPYMDEEFLSFSLLSRKVEYLNEYLFLCEIMDAPMTSTKNLQYCLGGGK